MNFEVPIPLEKSYFLHYFFGSGKISLLGRDGVKGRDGNEKRSEKVYLL